MNNIKVVGRNYLVEHVFDKYVDLNCGKVIKCGAYSHYNGITEGAKVLYRRGDVLKPGYSIVHADEIVAVVIKGEENHED